MKIRFTFISLITTIFSIAFLIFTSIKTAEPVTVINFLGEVTLPTGFSFQKTELGGLSGITYDPSKNVYYAISDDRSDKSPARFYTLKLQLSQGLLPSNGIVPIGVTTLLNKSNQPFTKGSIDGEGIAVTKKKTIFIASEGNIMQSITPFIKEFSLSTGRELQSLPIPEKFISNNNRDRGIRKNFAFESLTIAPNQKHLFTATENALIQDGAPAQAQTKTRCRILQYNLRTKALAHEFLYITEPVAAPLNIPGLFYSGLVDLLALDNNGNFLSLERAFNGLGYNIRLYAVALAPADDIRDIDSLNKVDISTIKPVKKQLLLDLNTLPNVSLDNIEGLTLGSTLANGQRLLVLISDNNFYAPQRTQVLAFALRVN